ncbi:MAG: diacylglycerol kinase family protein, partial [Parvibaculum sp.]
MTGRKRIDIIVNPAAGGRRNGLFDAVLRALHDGGAFVRCLDTEYPGHATALAAEAAAEGRADVIVAAGGDGTINEVAQGLMGTGVPMGVLPLGTANVLAIEIGQKLRVRSVADTLLHGDAKLIGTGLVNEELFLLMVGVGFDGVVVSNIVPTQKRRFGKFAFIWEGLKHWLKGPASALEVVLEGVSHRVAWMVVTNARHYAGPFTLSRTTDVTSPGLDVFLFRSGSRLAFALYFLGLALGMVHAMPWVQRVSASSLLVSPKVAGDASYRVEVDG